MSNTTTTSKFDTGALKSTYLLDLSKKCILSKRNAKLEDSDGIPWSFYGDLDSKDLSNIGFQFIEDFQSGTEYAQKEVDKVLSPITKGIEGVLHKAPIFKGVNLDTKTIRDSAIFLYAICKTLQGNNSTELSKNIAELDVSPYYNLPMRGSTPKLQPASAKGAISIRFAYGKCNLFCARQEVWEPLQALKNAIFPKASKDTDYGVINTSSNAAPVPYPVQITTALFGSILDMKGGISDNGFNIGEIKDGVVKNIFDLQENLKDISTSLESAENGIEVEDWEASITDALAAMNPINRKEFSTILTKKNFPKLKSALDNTTENVNSQMDFKGLPDVEAGVDANEVTKNYIDKVNEGVSTYILNNPTATVTVQPKKFKVKEAVEKGTNYKKVPKVAVSNEKTGDAASKKPKPDIIAKTLINFVPRLVGKTTMKLEQELEKYSYDMYFGFPPVYDTNLKTLYDNHAWYTLKKEEMIDGKKKKTTESVYTAAIRMTHFLFKKVTVSFDFDHLDDEGYPMSGTLKIEDVWNLEYPGNAVSIAQPVRLRTLPKIE